MLFVYSRIFLHPSQKHLPSSLLRFLSTGFNIFIGNFPGLLVSITEALAPIKSEIYIFFTEFFFQWALKSSYIQFSRFIVTEAQAPVNLIFLRQDLNFFVRNNFFFGSGAQLTANLIFIFKDLLTCCLVLIGAWAPVFQ